MNSLRWGLIIGFLSTVCMVATGLAEDKLSVKTRASSAFHGMDNADLRPLDERSDRAIIDSDDRRFFGHTDLQLELSYRVSPTLTTVGTSNYPRWSV